MIKLNTNNLQNVWSFFYQHASLSFNMKAESFPQLYLIYQLLKHNQWGIINRLYVKVRLDNPNERIAWNDLGN